jgi:chromosome segregation ATPase
MSELNEIDVRCDPIDPCAYDNTCRIHKLVREIRNLKEECGELAKTVKELSTDLAGSNAEVLRLRDIRDKIIADRERVILERSELREIREQLKQEIEGLRAELARRK